MFLRTIRYLLGDGYPVWIGLLVLGAVAVGFFGTWVYSLGVVALLFLVDYFREDYNRCPWQYRHWFTE